MTQLVVLGGTGDAYLICALVNAFEAHHGRGAQVVVHERLEAVAQMFDVNYRVDTALVDHAQGNQAFQRSYENQLFSQDIFYAHPCFMRSGVRVDQLTAHPDASQADMYRMMLRLPITAPLSLPRVPEPTRRQGTVLLIVESTSWPNTQPDFWPRLGLALAAAGREVTFNNMLWSLRELFHACAASEWVIGPQCGAMSILATGRFPCRKTLCTPSIDGNIRPDYWALNTYPYGYVTKFDHCDYDVEEYKITDDNHGEVIDCVLNGVNANALWPHDPAPTTFVTMPLTPGDFLDRLAVLTIKRQRFAGAKRAAMEREYLRYVEQRNLLGTLPPPVNKAYARLEAVHALSFELLNAIVPLAITGVDDLDGKAHGAVIRLNIERVALKNEIDTVMHAAYGEVKGYGEEGR